MKTRNKFIAMALIAIMGIAFIGCGGNDDSPQEKPKQQPDTPRSLSFGTPETPVKCTITIKSDDQFTVNEWKTLCDKVVAAVERGYNAFGVLAKNGITTYFTNNTVSALLLKSATYDCEVKSTVPYTMYFKANASAIDGITGDNMAKIFNTLRVGGSSYHLPWDEE